jgi:hypothetical protein
VYLSSNRHIVGAGAGGTTIDPPENSAAVFIEFCGDSSLGGLTFTDEVGIFASTVSLDGCEFAGVSSEASTVDIANSEFKSDIGLEISAGTVSVENCTFEDCDVAVRNYTGSPTITNCSFRHNGPSEGVVVSRYSSAAPVITNCIFWDNYTVDVNDLLGSSTTATYSLIDWDGTGNINTDPLWDDGILGFPYLQSTSPCIDSGDPCMEGVDGDGDGIERVDMGSQEYECYWGTEKDTWVNTGSPYCWCYQYNCKGDSDNEYSGKGDSARWVTLDDLAIFNAAWLKPISDPNWLPEYVCADHARDTKGKGGGTVHVGLTDLAIFNAGWLKPVTHSHFAQNPCQE